MGTRRGGWLALAVALAGGPACTRTHRRTDETILEGPSSRIVVRCSISRATTPGAGLRRTGAGSWAGSPLTTRFKLWHVASGRVLEIDVPVSPSPSSYDLDAYLTACTDAEDASAAAFTRVDLAATIEAGERVAITGVRPYPPEERASGDRTVACRQAVRAAPTGE